MLSDEDFDFYWNEWCQQESANYLLVNNKKGGKSRKFLKKGYMHFDSRFWFPERKNEIKKILKNKLRVYNKKHKQFEWHAFTPFIKMLIKTPRFKFQTDQGKYDLETKIRPICFASHIDSLIFGFYSFVLTRKYEAYIEANKFDECVLAYRSNLQGKCNIQFAKEVFEEIQLRGKCTAIALDIKGYFDHIEHVQLKNMWNKVLGNRMSEDQYKIFRALTEYSYVRHDSLLKKYKANLKKLRKNNQTPSTLLELIPGAGDFEKYDTLRKDRVIVKNNKPNKKSNRIIGIPQGSAMSALLSNIYLIDFDKILKELSLERGFMYRRYCDDILIVCNSEDAKDIEKLVLREISNPETCQLEIQPKKVETIEFRETFKGKIRGFNRKKLQGAKPRSINSENEKKYYKSLQYLGFEYNGQNTFIRASSLSKYFRKMTARAIKTVSMVHSKKSKGESPWKKQIFERYTHLGRRNFIKYAYNAASFEYQNSGGIIQKGLNSDSIRKQVSRHSDILNDTLFMKNKQRINFKIKKGKRNFINLTYDD